MRAASAMYFVPLGFALQVSARSTMMSGPHQPLPPTGSPGGQRRHVFVLDADSAFLEVVGDLLADANVRATLELLQGDVAGVCERLAAEPPDLVLMDVAPQRTEAEALLQRMEADAALRAIGVLLVSTNLGDRKSTRLN